MPKVNVHKPGSLCWIELATSDQPSAKKFYEQLFGWTADDRPMGPDSFYTMFKLDGRDVAAACTLRPDQLQRGVPPHWNLYVAVANVDESAERAGELGASVLAPPFDVFDAGRMAIIQDPTGAILSLWQAKEHSGVLVNNEEGALCWADLMTRDRDKAADFYSALLGWKIEKERRESGTWLLPHQEWGGLHRRDPAHGAYRSEHHHALAHLLPDCRLRSQNGRSEVIGGKRVLAEFENGACGHAVGRRRPPGSGVQHFPAGREEIEDKRLQKKPNHRVGLFSFKKLLFRPALEHQAAVGAPKPKRIRDRIFHADLARGMRHVIQVAFRIGMIEIDGGRHDLIA
jgi:predicted enzyme related to lactoylglutathione lyase